MEDVWRGEVQDLHSQISQLQAENKRVLGTLSLKQASVSEDELQKQEGGFSATAALCQVKRDEFGDVSSYYIE